jgi:hypothetical protein
MVGDQERPNPNVDGKEYYVPLENSICGAV